MRLRSLPWAAVLFGTILAVVTALAQTATCAPAPSTGAAVSATIKSPPPLPAYSTAPYAERLAAAKSVKVNMSILGVKLGSTLEEAHEKLDKLCDSKHRPKEETEEETKEGERKVLWELAKTDYSFVFVKADERGRITYVSGFLRKGKEIPFAKIGQTDKAPMQDANTIAWDVLRPGRPLSRVVATGAERKASSIMLFVVKRPGWQAGASVSDK